ncbi:hypothetical protein [Curtobacterium pusillum]|uniref:hypothetical protein n=1 Tax=Curtobacterium pusillum TaxID=69373 RepID=UPI0011A95B5C|nr:hypothetical protein [Curtobacterium pusillum]
MRDQHHLQQLRQVPSEWHRRGMTSPAEIDALVATRVGETFSAVSGLHAEPSYADFFVAPTAA